MVRHSVFLVECNGSGKILGAYLCDLFSEYDDSDFVVGIVQSS